MDKILIIRKHLHDVLMEEFAAKGQAILDNEITVQRVRQGRINLCEDLLIYIDNLSNSTK